MPQLGRPRQPSYASITKVLNAIRLCSCGRAESRRGASNNLKSEYFRILLNCKCIGPKTTSELHRLTGLHRNTLGKTCKFLVKRKALARKVLRRRGHHVVYSMSDEYDELTRAEVELLAGERERFYKAVSRFGKAMLRLRDDLSRFDRRYSDSIKLLKDRWPEATQLPFPQYRYLVRLIDSLGEEEGFRTFLRKQGAMDPLSFNKFASNAVLGRRELKRITGLLYRGK